jgi:protein SCO1
MNTHNGAERGLERSRQKLARLSLPVHFAVRSVLSVISVLLTLVCFPGRAAAQPSTPKYVPPPGKVASEQIPMLKDVGIDQKLNEQIPLDLSFSDETGRGVTLGQFFGSRPVLLALVYYECPMLCTQVLHGLVGSLEGISFTAGKEFEVVFVSFDPGETPTLAADRKQYFLRRYGHPEAAPYVHFLTGRETSITALTSAVGFRYAYDAQIDQFAHPAAITLLTGEGRVSRYLYGIEFAPRDLKLALVEASEGKIGSVVEQILLFCYHYDPESGKYGLVIMNFVRLAAALTVIALGASVFLSLRRERRRHDAVRTTATGTR